MKLKLAVEMLKHRYRVGTYRTQRHTYFIIIGGRMFNGKNFMEFLRKNMQLFSCG